MRIFWKPVLALAVSSGLSAACAIGVAGAWPMDSFAQAAAPRGEPGSLRERWRQRALDRGRALDTADARITGPGDYSFSLVHAGLMRLYRVHVPPGYSPAKPMPLVFSLHGGGGNMDFQANDAYYGQIAKSDQAGYVVVFPNGYSAFSSGKFATWNAGNCCASARDQGIDDVGFVREIVKRLGAQPGIDAKRIFANGISNGGMMAYRLACEMPEVFKAIASVAGTDNTQACSPTAPVSILHIHAKDDELELFGGGAGRQSSKVAAFVSVPDSIAKWVRLNGCTAGPQRVFETAGAYCDAYTSCRGGVEVKLCVTETGGHSWPGGKRPRGGAPGSTAISATEVIAEFFASR